MARILIGIPCYGDVPPEIYEDHCRFMYYLGRRYLEHTFFLGIKIKSEQFRARNNIVKSAMDAKCDWVLMIDDDMVIDINDTMNVDCGKVEAYEFLSKLLSHGEPLVGGLYVTRGGLYEPVALKKVGDTYRKLRWEEVKYDELTPVDSVGGGVMLISCDMLRRMAVPIFSAEYEYGTDIQLCRKAQELGIQPYVDATVQLGHMERRRDVVTPKNYQEFITKKILQRSVEYAPVVYDTMSREMMEDKFKQM